MSAEAATSLALDVGANQLKGVAHAVHVAALVVVARVHAGADQAMANVVAGRERGLDVGAIVRVHIDGVIELKLARDIGNRGYQVVVVRTARILGANRNHALGAAQVVTHAAHVHADHLARVGRHEGAAVSDLLVHGKEQRHLARKRHLASGDGTRQAQ